MRFQGDSYEQIVRDFAWEIPERFNIASACCDDWAAREPDRVALRQWRENAGDVTTTYGELAALSSQLANGLKSLGASAGDRVAIVLPQSLEAAATHLAIYKAGMIAVPLARLFQPDALEFRLHRAGCSAVVTDAAGAAKIGQIRARLPELRHVIVCGEDTVGEDEVAFEAVIARQARHFTAVETGPDTPALIIFTSGTTGPPKGALHGHRVVPGHLPGLKTHHEFMPQPGDVAWTPADWAWAGGLLNILLPSLLMGVPVVYGGLDRFDARKAFRLMSETGVRNAFIPPTALRLMRSVELPREQYPLALRTIGTGESLGAATHEWAEQSLGIRVNEFYGQTECNLVLSCFGAVGVMKAGSIGKPVAGHTVAVIDPKGGVCKPGERGEVAVLRPDPVMFLEYWQDEAVTAKKYRGDWLLTGDQAVVDDDGYFVFVGRDDDIINVAGYRVGPGEIEDSLLTHPAVRLAAAVGKPDPLKGEVVKAYVVLADGYEPGERLAEDIRRHVKGRMAANIYPREVEFVDSIPLTTTGKVIRRLFRDKAKAEAANA